MGGSGDGVRPDPRGPAYPEAWEADVVLRDGSTTHIRPIRPDDADALQSFHLAQSEQSTFLRFFAALERLPERDLTRFTHVDHRDRVALVAVTQDDAIIGVARYDRVGRDAAEVAFNIADAHHGRGLGSVLLEHLAAAARERGIRRFVAEVLPENTRMIAVFREAGFTLRQQLEDGVVQVGFDIDPTERSMAVMLDRERFAEARSVQGLLTARRVLLVAGDHVDPGSLDARRAGRVLSALLAGERRPPIGGRTGAVLAPILGEPVDVHVVGAVPGSDDPAVRRWSRLEQVPRGIELAVLALPEAQLVLAMRALGQIGVRAVVVLSGGDPAPGGTGVALHRALLRTAHAAGMRVLGSESYGLIAHTPAGLVNASLAEDPPPPGRIGLFCQSAAMTVSVLAAVRRRGLGLAHLVSAGNRADVSGNDLMQFWQEDEATDVVALYLESIGNPRKFARVARRLGRRKPVVVVTAGTTGHVSAPGQPERTTVASRHTLNEVVRRSGVVLVENTHQMLEAAQLFALQPLPAGARIAVLASSGSLAALVAEAGARAGLSVHSAPTILPELADDEQIRAAIRAVYCDPESDAVIAVHLPTVGARDDRVAAALAHAAAHSGRTTVACLPGLHGATEQLTAADRHGALRTVPAYTTAEDAALALGQAARYASWRSSDPGTIVHPDPMDTRRARRLVQQWIVQAGRPMQVELNREQITDLLACAGIALVPSLPVDTADEAVAAAESIGWPVALKTTVPALRHRADLGGVRLDVHNAADLRADVRQVLDLAAGHRTAPGRALLEVQPMAPHGVACVVRSAEDPRYGPVLGFGLAGDTTDLLEDYAFAVPPLTDVDVADLVRAPRSAPRLFGYRGLPPLDAGALEHVLARVGVLADDVPELLSLELNPVVVAEHGATVLGASVHVGPAAVRADGVRRTLMSDDGRDDHTLTVGGCAGACPLH